DCFILRSTLVRGGDAELRLPKRRQYGHVSGSDGARIFFREPCRNSDAPAVNRRSPVADAQRAAIEPERRGKGAMTFVMMRMRRETRLRVLALLPQRHRDYVCEEIRRLCANYIRSLGLPDAARAAEARELFSEVMAKLLGAAALPEDAAMEET